MQLLRNCTIRLAVSLAIGVSSSVMPPMASAESMLLDLNLNHTALGPLAFFRRADGDFLIGLSDLQALGLRPDIALSPVQIEGESSSFVSLRELGATHVAMDTTQMALAVELPPALFDMTAIDLAASRTTDALVSTQHSGFVNYRLAESAYGNENARRSLATELGLRFGSALFLHQNLFREDGSSVRYLTQVLIDNPARQQRLVLGDFSANSSDLGSTLPMGGVNFSKLYSLAPDLVRQPLAGFSGVTESPSVVEVRVNGMPLAQSQIAAGPFALQNLRYYGGASDVQILVRDALGREQSYAFSYYFSDQSLREGLQEYSYSLGKLRLHPGQLGDAYGNSAFSGFHRFGYSDALTLGARAEASEGLSNAGVEAVWRSDQLGVVAASASASNYQGISGQAAMLAYTYLHPRFGVRAIARHYDEGYAPLETLVSHFNRLGDYGLSLSWYPAPGHTANFSLGLAQTSNQGSTRTAAIQYQHAISAASQWYATLRHTETQTDPTSQWSLFLGWIYRFGGKHTAAVYASTDDHGLQRSTTELQRDVPFGEGVGYRLGWTGTQPDNTQRFSGFAQWNLPALSLSLDSNTQSAQGHQLDYHEFAAAGSIAFAGPNWGLTRTINDSFAIVQMGAAIPGVHVLANSQEVGISDNRGQVINPNLGSFYESRLSIADKDVPLDYVIGRDFYTIKPAYRSGVLVKFGLRRLHALDGVLRWRLNDQTPTADNQQVSLSHHGQLVHAFQVGRDGHFYLEDVAPGDYQGSIQTPNHRCNFVMQVPEQREAVYTVPGDLLCE